MKWPAWKKLLPQYMVEKTGSEKNPYLEVVLEFGKPHLNTKESNFSFGNLHTVFEEGFKYIDLKNQSYHNILLLGLGAGSVIDLIRNTHHLDTKITAIEYDAVVIDLAKKYFNIEQYQNLTIIEADAFEFVKNSSISYDLIIIDIYQELEVPQQAHEPEFLNHLKQLLADGGLIMFNKVVNNEKQKLQYHTLFNFFHPELSCKTLQIMGINYLLLAEKK